MNPKYLNFVKARKRYILVLILILVVAIFISTLKADIVRFYYELPNQIAGWKESEHLLVPSHLEGEILIYFRGELDESEVKKIIESYGLYLKDSRKAGINRSFRLAHVIVPVGKEQLWLHILSKWEDDNIECLSSIRDYTTEELIQEHVYYVPEGAGLNLARTTIKNHMQYKKCEEIRSIFSFNRTPGVADYRYFLACIKGGRGSMECEMPNNGTLFMKSDSKFDISYVPFFEIENLHEVKLFQVDIFIPPDIKPGRYDHTMTIFPVGNPTINGVVVTQQFSNIDFDFWVEYRE